MQQERDADNGIAPADAASRQQDTLASPGYYPPSVTAHTLPTTANNRPHTSALEDMLDRDVVEQEDAAIECAERLQNRTDAGAGTGASNIMDFKSTSGLPHPSAAAAGRNGRIIEDEEDEYDDDGRSPSINNSFSDPPSYEQGLGHQLRCHAKLMRHRDRGTKVTNVELFFDLVFVYAISSISETMVEDLSWEVLLQMFNPDSYLVRLLLLTLMLASLIMSAVIQNAFEDQSLLFAGMYVLIQVGRNVAAVIALHRHKLQRNFYRLLFWFMMTGVLWLVGGAIGGTTRNVLWTVAIVLEYMSPALGFYTPFIGKSLSTDWDVHGGHLAERCSLFIIIALGESIVVTGEAFRHVIHEPAGVGMFIVAFVGAAAMWWIYFHTAADEAIRYIERSRDPGKMGRIAYTYIHVFMVIGIIWCAVADRISIEDPYHVPHHDGSMTDVAIMIGGPVLFVLGHALFRRAFRPRLPRSHLLTVAVLLCATPIGIYLPLWATALTTTSILLALGFYESYFRCYVLPTPAEA
ncbi:hypothetical protein BGZ99_001022 [Dissophora globulifera]|uniref:Low temperature requirement A n=1 Tax=Dissophora globulifera TaxID=979702 RepID=A0A9P6UKV1_9FUNG|nr:hypothetical protein BGZ99_001022 [Dissophora globulifera]